MPPVPLPVIVPSAGRRPVHDCTLTSVRAALRVSRDVKATTLSSPCGPAGRAGADGTPPEQAANASRAQAAKNGKHLQLVMSRLRSMPESHPASVDSTTMRLTQRQAKWLVEGRRAARDPLSLRGGA